MTNKYPAATRAVRRARWLGELARTLHHAAQLARQLEIERSGSSGIRDLSARPADEVRLDDARSNGQTSDL
jgi:hypothetical protein